MVITIYGRNKASITNKLHRQLGELIKKMTVNISNHISKLPFEFGKGKILKTLQAPTPQNGQTQTIRQEQPTNFLSVFDHFVGLALKGLR